MADERPPQPTTPSSQPQPQRPSTSTNDTTPPPHPSLSSLPPALRTLAHSTLNHPSFRPISMSRTLTHHGRGHTLMALTWNTPTTIPYLLSFYRANAPWDHPDPSQRLEVRRFYMFGEDLNAHPELLHGGVVSVILDSSIGGVVGMGVQQLLWKERTKGEGISVHKGRREQREEDWRKEGASSMFTVQLNVRYKNPIRTPGGVMVRSWVTKIEEGGRKVWAQGVVEGKDGKVHAEAEGMWLRGKAKL